ncbi:MAG: ABC transporter ATP-binding protein [Oscillospiraceae bacterium]|nr:ABC transporter ATP-binding protein [Oscillospiraceae bacterium]
MIRKLLRSVREFKTPAIITFLFMVGEAIIECIIPFITANLMNQIKEGIELSKLLTTGGILVALAIISLSFGGAAGYTSAKASSGFARNLRNDLFDKIQTFSFDNVDRFSSSSLVTRLTTDVVNVQMSFMMLIRTAIRSPLMFIFSIIMAYVMGGKLAMVFVIAVPIIVVGLYIVSRKAMPAFKRVFKKYDKLNESIEENVRGMRVVKGFAKEEFEKEKFAKAAGDIRDDFTRAERIVAFNQPIMQVCLYIIMVFSLSFGSYMVISSRGLDLDVGHISAILTYGMQVLMSLMMLSMIYVMITISIESMKRITEILDEEPTIINPKEPVFEVEDGSIEFRNVDFKYFAESEKCALEGVNLKIESGMTVGVIGGTGSGKSTLVQLIPRLYDATNGEVLVGGVNVRDYDLKTLRDSVAMVLQKNQLFSGTIRENLLWGDVNASDEEIQSACEFAQADEFIRTFPDGYETYIEQGGTNVSGGQKQRLCIARALLKKPKVLILDDSTSAVDTKTDAKIRLAFKEYIPETTKIIIAQRVASVKESDIIIVMDRGSVVAFGNHATLLSSCEIYKEIYEEQIGGGEDE